MEQPSINKHIPRGFNFNSGDNHGWFPKGIPLPNIDKRKFDGKDLLGVEPDYLRCVKRSCLSQVWNPYPNREVWGSLPPPL